MKKVLVLLALFVVFAALPVHAETVAFTKPTTYEDSSAISGADSALMQTSIEYRVLPSTTWATFGTAVGGASSLVLPYVTPQGSTSSWRARARIGSTGAYGAYSTEVSFSRSIPAPSAPNSLTIN